MDVQNIAQVFVCKDVAAADATTQIYNKDATGYPVTGQVVATTKGGAILTTVTANDTSIEGIVLRERNGSSLLKTAEIKGNQVISYKVDSYAAATEEIWTVGYNGTSGVFTTILTADTQYSVRLVRKDDSLLFAPERYKRADYRSGSVAPTQETIVNELGVLLGLTFSSDTVRIGNDLDLQVRVERLNDGALTATDLPNNCVVTEGSRYVTTTGAITANLTAGTYVRLDGVTYQLAENATATTLVLDIPYQGTSGTVLAANAGSAAAGTNWGIRFTGKPQTFEPGLLRYEKTIFDVEVNENIDSVPVRVQAANKGVGTYEEAAEKEWEGIGYFGKQYLVNSVNNSRTLLADSTCTYDRVSIAWDNKTVDNVAGSVNHSGNVTIYVPTGDDQADAATYGWVGVLDAYIVTAFGKGTAQIGNLTP